MFKTPLVCLIAVIGFCLVGCNRSAPPSNTPVGPLDTTTQTFVDKEKAADPNAAPYDNSGAQGFTPGSKGQRAQQRLQNNQ